jgi:hypothetical protein
VTSNTFGSFIQPDRSLESLVDPNENLGCVVQSGFRAMNQAPGAGLLGRSRIFDAIWKRWCETPLECEDQCSAQYYYDLVAALRDFNGEFSHVVEVGCYMGGATSILAGCMDSFDFTLDIVDISTECLRYSYERARRMYPQAADRIRIFHGDLPSYVREVMLAEPREGTIVHHDGAHDFNQVVKDMASLSFVREQLYAIIAQDTHLRGTVHHMTFVDMALYAVFGLDLNYCPIGARYEDDSDVTRPNIYQGHYFVAGQAEGVVLPMAVNEFHYPHPELSIDDFLPAPLILKDQAA